MRPDRPPHQTPFGYVSCGDYPADTGGDRELSEDPSGDPSRVGNLDGRGSADQPSAFHKLEQELYRQAEASLVVITDLPL